VAGRGRLWLGHRGGAGGPRVGLQSNGELGHAAGVTPGFRGHQDPGANIITRCARTKSYTYEDSWYRNKCHNMNI
jgi:hypothetical protein